MFAFDWTTTLVKRERTKPQLVMGNNNKPPLHPSLKGIKYVLFPQDKYVQYWDNTFLCVLIYYCFSIPYTAGVSGGYWMYHYEWWFIVNMILNAFYLGKRVKFTVVC